MAVAGLTLWGASLASTAGAAPRLRIPVPRAGETTVAVTQVIYRGKAPARAKLKLKNRAKLGPNVRGLYAIYRKRRGRRTIFTVFNLVLRRSAAQARASASPSNPNPDTAAFIYFFVSAGFRDESVFEEHEPITDLFYKLVAISIGRDRDTEPSAEVQRLLEMGGIAIPPASDPFDLGPSLIDTGHYDDGHSFGWNNAGTKPAIADWLRLSANNAPYEELIEKIERRMSEDLNGDGEVGGGGSGGGSIETEVGPPVIH